MMTQFTSTRQMGKSWANREFLQLGFARALATGSRIAIASPRGVFIVPKGYSLVDYQAGPHTLTVRTPEGALVRYTEKKT